MCRSSGGGGEVVDGYANDVILFSKFRWKITLSLDIQTPLPLHLSVHVSPPLLYCIEVAFRETF